MSEPLSRDQLLLGRYRVVDKIDSSTFSAVFRGRDERLRRSVCIKVFRNTAKGNRAGRISYLHFVQEAYALSQLSHPNTLRIFDFGNLTEEFGPFVGAPFQITEFMEGGTLASLVQNEGPLSAAETAAMVVPLCGALSEAHQRGIVHRDIKPKNILFGAVGKQHPPKLADFGIAKMVDSSSAASGEVADGEDSLAGEETKVLEGPPLVICTAVWASPEQLMGRPADPTVDIYSLGLLVVFMLTGGQLFAERKGNRGLIERQQSDRMIEELLARHKIGPPVVRVLQKACHFDPGQRQANILELSSALSAALLDPGTVLTVSTERARGPSQAAGSAAELPPGAGMARPPDVPARPESPLIELLLFPEARRVGDRMVRCLASDDSPVEVSFPVNSEDNARIRVSFMWGGESELYLHIKGLNCFVGREGQRPSAAVQLSEDGAVDLLSPTRQLLIHLGVIFAKSSSGAMIYSMGGQKVAVPRSAALGSVFLDPGPGKECWLVYVPVKPELPGDESLQKRRKTSG